MLSDAQIKEIHKIIGKNVAKIRKEKKYSQLKLSLEMGHNSVSLVSFAEIGLKGAHFNIEHLLQIASILEVDITEFFKDIHL
ncbi:helix-turn-helix transcriptional regulator [Helicobacter sp.]|uniref:helix-turn-helix domain-containing protein n=1 Tax=Helicobacter sp. TaxID=218 RepID=UPI002A757A3D|nr:helix-turn-helix transcriptional regulator [Helicobacter sp.]MDY2584876.1 helix-turn-helix transcriptional regulator [Helicobacter sp.]